MLHVFRFTTLALSLFSHNLNCLVEQVHQLFAYVGFISIANPLYLSSCYIFFLWKVPFSFSSQGQSNSSSPSCWGPSPPEGDSRRERGRSWRGCPPSHWWPESRWTRHTRAPDETRRKGRFANAPYELYSPDTSGIQGKPIHRQLFCFVFFKPAIITACSSTADPSAVGFTWITLDHGFDWTSFTRLWYPIVTFFFFFLQNQVAKDWWCWVKGGRVAVEVEAGWDRQRLTG